MSEKVLFKIGYYEIYEEKTPTGVKFVADSGKTINLKRFNKVILNPHRDIKKFNTMDGAKTYAKKKIKTSLKKKDKILDKLPKSLYLVLLKEIVSGKTFVKVGITSKKFIVRRFSKEYGYEGYILESILRRVESPNAEKMESEIKDSLNKKRTAKYRPLLENFSGYSECYDYINLDFIIKTFDQISSKG
jgi:hypothetical protein